VHRSSPNWVCR